MLHFLSVVIRENDCTKKTFLNSLVWVPIPVPARRMLYSHYCENEAGTETRPTPILVENRQPNWFFTYYCCFLHPILSHRSFSFSLIIRASCFTKNDNRYMQLSISKHLSPTGIGSRHDEPTIDGRTMASGMPLASSVIRYSASAFE